MVMMMVMVMSPMCHFAIPWRWGLRPGLALKTKQCLSEIWMWFLVETKQCLSEIWVVTKIEGMIEGTKHMTRKARDSDETDSHKSQVEALLAQLPVTDERGRGKVLVAVLVHHPAVLAVLAVPVAAAAAKTVMTTTIMIMITLRVVTMTLVKRLTATRQVKVGGSPCRLKRKSTYPCTGSSQGKTDCQTVAYRVPETIR